jgi:selenocysteine lyase/cysteine desulfurase
MNSPSLEEHFAPFAEDIVGRNAVVDSHHGVQALIYADWVASGRAYEPIERVIKNMVLPKYGNTHTDDSETGTRTTAIYHESKEYIREHVGGSEDDVVITVGSGMTGAIDRLQRILGFKNDSCESLLDPKPVVFVTHMEHHSNHTSWLECDVDVVIIAADEDGLPDLDDLSQKAEAYSAEGRPIVGAFTAGSNVTGVETAIYQMAEIMHENGGLCFADFAALAPYKEIDMHPEEGEDSGRYLDAVYLSPHKYLGGPGSAGVVVFNKDLYKREVPVVVGGGVVTWTSPSHGHRFYDNEEVHSIESREDAGTPPILQTIRAAMAMKVKDAMDPVKMKAREDELLEITFDRMDEMDGVHILADKLRDRYGIVSFYAENAHYGLIVKMLNDRFGIQMRGGCACAGTYGHYLFDIDEADSKVITDQIDEGDLTNKPGFVRLSLHPTLSNYHLEYILDAISQIVENIDEWKLDYQFDSTSGSWKYVADGYDAESAAEDVKEAARRILDMVI